MRKRITRLMYIGIACLCMLPALGQEKTTFERKVKESDFQRNNIEIRSDGTKGYWWPDSLIFYDSAGKPYSKEYYNSENQTIIRHTLSNGNWSVSGSYISKGFTYYSSKVTFEKREEDLHYLSFPGGMIRDGGFFVRDDMSTTRYNAVYNSKGNLTLLEFIQIPYSNAFSTYRMTYNENDDLILMQHYAYDRLVDIWNWVYNENNDIVVYEWSMDCRYNGLGCSDFGEWISNEKEIVKYDEKGRPVISQYFSRYKKLYSYYISYYSDGRTPDAEVEGNTPVNDNNQGNFDLTVNIPVDSVQSGSLVVQLPDGFTLDEANTSLTVDFAELFDLTITKQESNSWLIEIKPKSLKSAALRADEIGKMLHIAYKVDDNVQKGTYNISINSILFKTPGDNIIPEPAITVPVDVNRGGVGNDLIEGTNTAAYMTGNTLYIQTAQSEQIAVYTTNGSKLYESTVQPGITTIDASAFPQGVLIVKGSSGWVKKVVAS